MLRAPITDASRLKDQMKSIAVIALGIALLSGSHALAQEDLRRVQREKLEAILRIQDLRTTHDSRLVTLLQDKDPVVRERALLAYANLRDTSALGLITNALTDSDDRVQRAASFALGQTGTTLSLAGKAALEHDLLWKRLPQTRVADQLIEDIGTFGTEEGLRDLIMRMADTYPQVNTRGLLMGIARFAIRGIATANAVRYCLRWIRPAEQAPWEAIYALQRTGDRPETRGEVESLVLVRRNRDPLARMHLATLLGKLKTPAVVADPLMELAEFDNDWRVRVNALRSLSAAVPVRRPAVLQLLRKAFFDRDHHIRMTALAAVRTLGLTAKDTDDAALEVVEQLRHIARNPDNGFFWAEQAEGALSLASILGPPAYPDIQPTRWPNPLLQAQMLRAAGLCGAAEAVDLLLSRTGDESAAIRCGALEGLRSYCLTSSADSSARYRVRQSALQALQSTDVAVRSTAASILGDSIFRAPSSVGPLLDALRSARAPEDEEAILEILSTLEKIGDSKAVIPLLDLLTHRDRPIAAAAARALTGITGTSYHASLRNEGEPLFVDLDFRFLAELPDTVKVEMSTSRGTIGIALFKNSAPFTVMSFLKLATQRGFYRGTIFHRVVPNFVIQGGDPRGDGWGGPGYSLRTESTPVHYETGSVGMASAGRDTEGSQFFITHSPQPHLDGRYTLFGQITSGMEIVDDVQIDDRVFDIRIVP
jgi:cyclophilin family peptidyl-prolyl cis-trans isomerase/HEAT repeat protein